MAATISQSDQRWIHATAIFIVLIGVMNLMSAWFSFDLNRVRFLEQVFDYKILFGSRFFVSVIGFGCFVIAPGLYRRKRLAWYIAVLLLGLSGIAHILKGADILEACICMLLTGVLLPLYSKCSVKSDPLQIRYGIFLFLCSILCMAFCTLLGLTSFHRGLGIPLHSIPVLTVFLKILSFDVSMLHPHGRRATLFVDSILWLNAFFCLSAVGSLLAPVVLRSWPTEERKRSQELAHQFASQPVQPIATTAQYFQWVHPPSMNGFVAYNLIGRLALALGNPCGSESPRVLLQDWLSFAIDHDWIPALYQADESLMIEAKALGFDSLPIGTEAMVDLETFSLQGKSMQDLRSAFNKGQKQGWTLRPYQPGDWSPIQRINQQWLSKHGTQEEIVYGMGSASPEYLATTRSTVLIDAENHLLGYVNTLELPAIQSRGVDLMRRDPASTGGVMESLILHEILKAKEDGCRFYDLGLSALAQMADFPTDNPKLTQLLTRFYDKQKSLYDFQGLHQFKAKFNPTWQPRYLLYKGMHHLPTILLALIELNQGKHFWRKWLRSYFQQKK